MCSAPSVSLSRAHRTERSESHLLFLSSSLAHSNQYEWCVSQIQTDKFLTPKAKNTVARPSGGNLTVRFPPSAVSLSLSWVLRIRFSDPSPCVLSLQPRNKTMPASTPTSP